MCKEYLKYFFYAGCMACCLSSCSTAATLSKANRMYAEGGYSTAAAGYKRITGRVKPPQREQVYFHLAECYRRLGRTREAETAYMALFRRVKTPNNPEAYLRYGQILLANGKYDKAEEQFAAYKQHVPDNPLADAGIASVALAKARTEEQPTNYTVERVAALNASAGDFAPAYGADDYETLLITSTRTADNRGKRKYEVTGEVCSDIYYARLSRAGKWDKPRNMGEAINTQFEEGAAVFNSSYNTLYFTRCQKVQSEKTGCKIYVAQRDGDDWGDPEALEIAPDSITVAHPALSDDELTLYFASDLGSGGTGTMDIWKVTRNNAEGSWGEPINAGPPVNTRGNELYPFIRAGGVLYFASDGHAGFGGLDIFRAVPDSLGSWRVENMGAPINSAADDFSLIMERENERGFFASRRRETGARGSDNIFRFERREKVVEYFFEGIAQDDRTHAVLKEADIRLIGSNGASLRKRTEDDGTFRFRVNAGLDYLVIASRSGYLNGKLRFATTGWENGHTLRDTFYLTSTDRPIEIPNIFFDFGKATLSAASRRSLDSLVGIMKDNPNIVIELRAHTDSRGGYEVNQKLSQQRAQAVVDYLINNGIDELRMEAVGLGDTAPKVVDEAIARQHPFLRTGQKLDEKFINSLAEEAEQEACHALNRRTELQVIHSNYVAE